jgi:tetratricopeptide (TPR) repeat protein
VGWLGNQTEARHWVKLALEAADKLPPVTGEALLRRRRLLARAYYVSANTEIGQGDNQFALQALTEAVSLSRLSGDQSMLGTCLELYALTSSFTGASGGLAAAKEGLAILQEVGDQVGITVAYLIMARIVIESGNLSEQQKYLDKASGLLQGIKSSYLSGMSIMGLGMRERLSGRHESAREYFEAGLIIFKRMHNKHFENVMLSELGHIARQSGDYTQAVETYKKTIVHWQEVGSRSAIAHQLECFALIAVVQDQPQRATRLFGAAQALRERIDSHMMDYERVEYDQTVERLHASLAGAEFDALWAEGRQLTMEQAIEFALN